MDLRSRFNFLFLLFDLFAFGTVGFRERRLKFRGLVEEDQANFHQS